MKTRDLNDGEGNQDREPRHDAVVTPSPAPPLDPHVDHRGDTPRLDEASEPPSEDKLPGDEPSSHTRSRSTDGWSTPLLGAATALASAALISKVPGFSEFTGLSTIAEQFARINLGEWNRFALTGLAGLSANTLSASGFFKEDDPRDYAYSPELLSPASYFRRDEIVISSFEDLNREIATLIALNPSLPLVWRGQQDHEWGLQSSLFLALQRKNGVRPPSAKPKGVQPHPTEDQLRHAEAKLIQHARDYWRLDEMPSLELLARLQHHGAPTRLIDVTRNPYIAAWFAVEESAAHDRKDGRLFALATRPLPKKGQEDLIASIDTSIRLSEIPPTPLPFWHYWESPSQRQEADWGTGAKRRVWIPPAYDQRIVSQNAAFVVDGVPIFSAQTAPYFKQGRSSGYWNKADLLASSSIYVKTYNPHNAPRPNKPNFSPTFTYRITSDAKDEIRDVLERRFSYNYATIYPDISAAGRYLKSHFDEITE